MEVLDAADPLRKGTGKELLAVVAVTPGGSQFSPAFKTFVFLMSI